MVIALCAGLTTAQIPTSTGAGADTTSWSVPEVPAQRPALHLDCADGRVDLNHASETSLTTLPGIDADIARRIISSRPHDRVQDLLVVPGIGPGKLNEIAATGRTCSTPLTLPPPAGDVCVVPEQVDVNDPSSRPALVRLFGAPTADRVVAASPFPDLAHAKVVLAAGAGPGKVAKYASRLCATPVPKIHSNVAYAWTYAATGGRDDYAGFSLVVPAGVIDDPIGSWVHIAPTITPPPGLTGPEWPSADFHVYAPWEGASDVVYVTLPVDPLLQQFGPYFEPVLGHWADATRSGGEEHRGDDVLIDTTTPSITAAVSHLSFIDALSGLVQRVFEPAAHLLGDARFAAPSCDGTWQLDDSTGHWSRTSGARVELTSAYLNLPDNPVPTLGWPIKHCVGGGNPNNTAALSLRNNTRTITELTTVHGTPGLAVNDNAADVLSTLLAQAATAVTGHPFLAPGGTATATVSTGTFATVRMRPNAALTGIWTLLNELRPLKRIIERVHLFGGGEGAMLLNDTIQCLFTRFTAGSKVFDDSSSLLERLENAGSVLKSCIDYEGLRVLLVRLGQNGTIPQDLVGRIGIELNELQRFIAWLPLARVGVSGLDTFLGTAGGTSAGLVLVENYAPKPALDTKGRRVIAMCLSPYLYTWRIDEGCQDRYYNRLSSPPAGSGGAAGLPRGIIARNSLGHAWFINTDAQTAQHIEDGGTYICLAKHYAVDWDASLGSYLTSTGGDNTFLDTPATCDGSIPDTRPLNPEDLPDDAFVLRQGDGTAWVVWGGSRIHIRTGGDFLCWVKPKYKTVMQSYVWDFVSDEQLAQWPVETSVYPSNCGDPENPTF